MTNTHRANRPSLGELPAGETVRYPRENDLAHSIESDVILKDFFLVKRG